MVASMETISIKLSYEFLLEFGSIKRSLFILRPLICLILKYYSLTYQFIVIILCMILALHKNYNYD